MSRNGREQSTAGRTHSACKPLRYSHVLVWGRVVVQGSDHALKSVQALHRFVRLPRYALILRRSEPGQHQVEVVVAAGAHPGPAVDFGLKPQTNPPPHLEAR